jgi:hypothetical protein
MIPGKAQDQSGKTMAPMQPDRDSTTNAELESKLIKKVAVYALLLSICLTTSKGIIAYHSGSLAVKAGAIDSGTIVVSMPS